MASADILTHTAEEALEQRRQLWWYRALRRTIWPAMFILLGGPYLYYTALWYNGQQSGLGYFQAMPPVWAIHLAITGTLIAVFLVERFMPITPVKLAKGELRMDVFYYFLRVHGQLLEYFVLAVGWVLTVALGTQVGLPEPWLPQVQTYLPFWAAILAACIVADFPDYWSHRALHGIPFLWRLHSVHHSSHNMYSLMTIRKHPLDYMFKRFCMFSVLYMCGFPFPVIAAWMIIRSYAAIMAHSNCDYWNPWLNYIFNTNHLHSWHHSAKASECNCNFGVGIMFWDQVFGTYYNPNAPLRPLRYGLFKEHRFPVVGFFRHMIVPFRWKYYMGDDKTVLPKTAAGGAALKTELLPKKQPPLETPVE